MWRDSVGNINTYLADETPSGLWYGVADMNTGRRMATTYGSLEAFLPAVFALGGDLDRARKLHESGFKMWTANGIEPEEFDYNLMRATRPGYQLRPEIIESAYYLSHYTKDRRFVEMGQWSSTRKRIRCDVLGSNDSRLSDSQEK
jgi:mannosidase alpha-like ER degradation enhancer 2